MKRAVMSCFVPTTAAWVTLSGVLLLTAVAQAEPLRLYVSPGGNDTWSGTLPQANQPGNDGPFRSLERARDEVRKLSAAGTIPAGGVEVELQAGIYELTAAFELGVEDSGTAERPIVYRSQRGEEVRLVGGKVIADWRPVTDPAVLNRMDPSARDKVLQADLKAQRVADLGVMAPGQSWGASDPGLEVFFADQRLRVQSIDTSQKRITLEPQPQHSYGFRDNVDHVRIESSIVRNTGGWGIELSGRESGVVGCDLYNLAMRGHMIRYNYFHHVYGFAGKGCNGVYLDDMFCSATIFGNIFREVPRAAFIGGGHDNVVENNVFVDCQPALHVDVRMMGWAAASVPIMK